MSGSFAFRANWRGGWRLAVDATGVWLPLPVPWSDILTEEPEQHLADIDAARLDLGAVGSSTSSAVS
jgi:hypothetical protein